MKNWQLTKKRELTLYEAEPSKLNPECEDIKVRVTKAVVDSSDISIYEAGEPCIVLCRSGVGLVSESNSEAFKKGQRVFLAPYEKLADGKKVTRGMNANGYLQDYVLAPPHCVKILPEGISEAQALFIDDIALAINAFERLKVAKSEHILIFGASALGAILAQIAVYYQAIPVIIDDDKKLLEKAKECGVYYTINLKEDNLNESVREITGGKLARHAAWDCDAFSGLSRMMFSYLKRGSNMCLMGFDPAAERLVADISPVLKNELILMGVNNGAKEIDGAINMLANEAVSVECYLGKSASFADAPKFFKKLDRNQISYRNWIEI